MNRRKPRYLWPTFLILLPAATVLFGGLQEGDPREVLSAAFHAHQSGDFETAIRGYRAFVGMVPNVADVYSNLGAALVQVGRLDEALSAYEEALRLGNATDPVAIHLNCALAYLKAARFPEAIQQLNHVLTLDPGHLQAALLLADGHLAREDNGRVIEILTPFEASHPEDKALAYLLGTALIRQGEVEKGQVLVDRILQHGESAEARLMMGTAYLMVRDVPGAVTEFERAIELNPNLPSANAFLAKTLREMGRVDDALVYSRRELEINPHDFESHLYVGVHLYKREQNYEEALRHFERCLRIRPGSLEARFQIGLVHLLQGNVELALEIVEAVVEEAPDFLEGNVTLTSLYFRLGRREDAERHRKIVERLRTEKDAQTLKEAVPDPEVGSDGPVGGREE
jgi:tetratricopeptide (TPR) repeat protein